MAARAESQTTRITIIDAAGRLFADKGFAGVTAREVASAADVALSAIPYHFGTMEALYREALMRACESDPALQPLAQKALQADPYDGLRMAVEWSMADAAPHASSWTLRLIAREEAEPSSVFKDVLERKLAPDWNWLCVVVARACGLEAGSSAVHFGVLTLYSLCSSPLTHRHILTHVAPSMLKAMEQRGAYVSLIADLSLDAVRRFERSLKSRAISESAKPSSRSSRSRRGGRA